MQDQLVDLFDTILLGLKVRIFGNYEALYTDCT
jgi:hypothetical protein